MHITNQQQLTNSQKCNHNEKGVTYMYKHAPPTLSDMFSMQSIFHVHDKKSFDSFARFIQTTVCHFNLYRSHSCTTSSISSAQVTAKDLFRSFQHSHICSNYLSISSVTVAMFRRQRQISLDYHLYHSNCVGASSLNFNQL